MLIDIGTNLTDSSFDRDRDAVMARAEAAGVGAMVVTGTDVPHSRAAAALAADSPGRLWATAGVHPHHASEWGDHVEAALRSLAARSEVVALGECGLDFNRDYSPRPAQRRAFEAQLALAVELRLPLFLHQRDAHGPFVELLRSHCSDLCGGVVHCFTGGPDELLDYLELGLHVGVTGWVCDERRAHELRASIPRIPLDRVLLETDAPYLLPRDLRPRPRSRRNEPMYLPHVCRAVARYMGVDERRLAEATTRNACRLFGLRLPPREPSNPSE